MAKRVCGLMSYCGHQEPDASLSPELLHARPTRVTYLPTFLLPVVTQMCLPGETYVSQAAALCFILCL